MNYSDLTVISQEHLLRMQTFLKSTRQTDSSKINKAFHSLALARALVTVLDIFASNPVFYWGIIIVITLWQIKNWNCYFGIEPHGCYKLKTKLMFVYYYLNTLNNFITYYVWISV